MANESGRLVEERQVFVYEWREFNRVLPGEGPDPQLACLEPNV